jgi:hypothetical protein
MSIKYHTKDALIQFCLPNGSAPRDMRQLKRNLKAIPQLKNKKAANLQKIQVL